jgi:hypothetical protein
MTIKHRVERLENKHPSSKQRIYLIVSKYGESRDEAKQRYCSEKEITTGELEAPEARIMMVRFQKHGDVTGVSAGEAIG